MDLSIKIEGAPDVRAMLDKLGKAAPDAVRMAANEIGLHMQLRMQREIGSRFSFRGTRAGFEKAVVFAKAIPGRKNRHSAVLKVGADGGGTKASATQKLGRILARHEEAGDRTTSNTVRLSTGETKKVGFFIPSGKFRSSTTNPPRGLYPSAIGAVMVRRTDGSYAYNSSVKKTRKKMGATIDGYSYTVTDRGIFRQKHGFDGVKNRKGHMSFRSEPVWWFTRRVRTPARLRMVETAQELFDKHAIGYVIDAIDTVIERST